MRLIRTGEIMTMKKFHSQWADTEIEVPLVRASSGRISGPYTVLLLALFSSGDELSSTLEVEPAQVVVQRDVEVYLPHGTTLIVPPKINMYRKKKVTAAEAVAFCPLLRRAASIIMQIERPAQPQIMVQRRPMRSRASAGRRLPMGNIL